MRNHKGEKGAQRIHEAALYSFLLHLGALEPKVRRTGGSLVVGFFFKSV
jgi:hypothetical protein